MEIQEKQINELKPYEKNPRKNDAAVEYVANSIKEFGFKVPIVIDKSGVIVCGHTRYKAAQRLKLKTVPCIIADDLTDEQIKAFRLADNKVSEKAEWDFDLLSEELDGIFDIDMEEFDFELPEKENEIYDEPKENHREATYKKYNLELVDGARLDGFYQMPIISKEEYIPDDLIGFNYMLTSKDKNVGIHCFVDDYQFERLWTSPQKYVEKIAAYDCFFVARFQPLYGHAYGDEDMEHIQKPIDRSVSAGLRCVRHSDCLMGGARNILFLLCRHRKRLSCCGVDDRSEARRSFFRYLESGYGRNDTCA